MEDSDILVKIHHPPIHQDRDDRIANYLKVVLGLDHGNLFFIVEVLRLEPEVVEFVQFSARMLFEENDVGVGVSLLSEEPVEHFSVIMLHPMTKAFMDSALLLEASVVIL